MRVTQGTAGKRAHTTNRGLLLLLRQVKGAIGVQTNPKPIYLSIYLSIYLYVCIYIHTHTQTAACCCSLDRSKVPSAFKRIPFFSSPPSLLPSTSKSSYFVSSLLAGAACAIPPSPVCVCVCVCVCVYLCVCVCVCVFTCTHIHTHTHTHTHMHTCI